MQEPVCFVSTNTPHVKDRSHLLTNADEENNGKVTWSEGKVYRPWKRSYSEEQLNQAIFSVMEKKMKPHHACKLYRIPAATLHSKLLQKGYVAKKHSADEENNGKVTWSEGKVCQPSKRSYSEEQLNQAIFSVMEKKMKPHHACKLYRIPAATLHSKLLQKGYVAKKHSADEENNGKVTWSEGKVCQPSKRSYSEEQLNQAIFSVMEKKMKPHHACKLYRIPAATLHSKLLQKGYVAKKHSGKPRKYNRLMNFTKKAEKNIDLNINAVACFPKKHCVAEDNLQNLFSDGKMEKRKPTHRHSNVTSLGPKQNKEETALCDDTEMSQQPHPWVSSEASSQLYNSPHSKTASAAVGDPSSKNLWHSASVYQDNLLLQNPVVICTPIEDLPLCVLSSVKYSCNKAKITLAEDDIDKQFAGSKGSSSGIIRDCKASPGTSKGLVSNKSQHEMGGVAKPPSTCPISLQFSTGKIVAAGSSATLADGSVRCAATSSEEQDLPEIVWLPSRVPKLTSLPDEGASCRRSTAGARTRGARIENKKTLKHLQNVKRPQRCFKKYSREKLKKAVWLVKTKQLKQTSAAEIFKIPSNTLKNYLSSLELVTQNTVCNTKKKRLTREIKQYITCNKSKIDYKKWAQYAKEFRQRKRGSCSKERAVCPKRDSAGNDHGKKRPCSGGVDDGLLKRSGDKKDIQGHIVFGPSSVEDGTCSISEMQGLPSPIGDVWPAKDKDKCSTAPSQLFDIESEEEEKDLSGCVIKKHKLRVSHAQEQKIASNEASYQVINRNVPLDKTDQINRVMRHEESDFIDECGSSIVIESIIKEPTSSSGKEGLHNSVVYPQVQESNRSVSRDNTVSQKASKRLLSTKNRISKKEFSKVLSTSAMDLLQTIPSSTSSDCEIGDATSTGGDVQQTPSSKSDDLPVIVWSSSDIPSPSSRPGVDAPCRNTEVPKNNSIGKESWDGTNLQGRTKHLKEGSQRETLKSTTFLNEKNRCYKKNTPDHLKESVRLVNLGQLSTKEMGFKKRMPMRDIVESSNIHDSQSNLWNMAQNERILSEMKRKFCSKEKAGDHGNLSENNDGGAGNYCDDGVLKNDDGCKDIQNLVGCGTYFVRNRTQGILKTQIRTSTNSVDGNTENADQHCTVVSLSSDTGSEEDEDILSHASKKKKLKVRCAREHKRAIKEAAFEVSNNKMVLEKACILNRVTQQEVQNFIDVCTSSTNMVSNIENSASGTYEEEEKQNSEDLERDLTGNSFEANASTCTDEPLGGIVRVCKDLSNVNMHELPKDCLPEQEMNHNFEGLVLPTNGSNRMKLESICYSVPVGNCPSYPGDESTENKISCSLSKKSAKNNMSSSTNCSKMSRVIRRTRRLSASPGGETRRGLFCVPPVHPDTNVQGSPLMLAKQKVDEDEMNIAEACEVYGVSRDDLFGVFLHNHWTQYNSMWKNRYSDKKLWEALERVLSGKMTRREAASVSRINPATISLYCKSKNKIELLRERIRTSNVWKLALGTKHKVNPNCMILDGEDGLPVDIELAQEDDFPFLGVIEDDSQFEVVQKDDSQFMCVQEGDDSQGEVVQEDDDLQGEVVQDNDSQGEVVQEDVDSQGEVVQEDDDSQGEVVQEDDDSQGEVVQEDDDSQGKVVQEDDDLQGEVVQEDDDSQGEVVQEDDDLQGEVVQEDDDSQGKVVQEDDDLQGEVVQEDDDSQGEVVQEDDDLQGEVVQEDDDSQGEVVQEDDDSQGKVVQEDDDLQGEVVQEDDDSQGEVVQEDDDLQGEVVQEDDDSQGEVVQEDDDSQGEVVQEDDDSQGEVVQEDDDSQGEVVQEDDDSQGEVVQEDDDSQGEVVQEDVDSQGEVVQEDDDLQGEVVQEDDDSQGEVVQENGDSLGEIVQENNPQSKSADNEAQWKDLANLALENSRRQSESVNCSTIGRRSSYHPQLPPISASWCQPTPSPPITDTDAAVDPLLPNVVPDTTSDDEPQQLPADQQIINETSSAPIHSQHLSVATTMQSSLTVRQAEDNELSNASLVRVQPHQEHQTSVKTEPMDCDNESLSRLFKTESIPSSILNPSPSEKEPLPVSCASERLDTGSVVTSGNCPAGSDDVIGGSWRKGQAEPEPPQLATTVDAGSPVPEPLSEILRQHPHLQLTSFGPPLDPALFPAAINTRTDVPATPNLATVLEKSQVTRRRHLSVGCRDRLDTVSDNRQDEEAVVVDNVRDHNSSTNGLPLDNNGDNSNNVSLHRADGLVLSSSGALGRVSKLPQPDANGVMKAAERLVITEPSVATPCLRLNGSVDITVMATTVDQKTKAASSHSSPLTIADMETSKDSDVKSVFKIESSDDVGMIFTGVTRPGYCPPLSVPGTGRSSKRRRISDDAVINPPCRPLLTEGQLQQPPTKRSAPFSSSSECLISGTLSLEHSSGTPSLEHSSRTPSLENSSGTPSLEHSSRTPSLEHSSGTPYLEHSSPCDETEESGTFSALKMPCATSHDCVCQNPSNKDHSTFEKVQSPSPIVTTSINNMPRSIISRPHSTSPTVQPSSNDHLPPLEAAAQAVLANHLSQDDACAYFGVHRLTLWARLRRVPDYVAHTFSQEDLDLAVSLVLDHELPETPVAKMFKIPKETLVGCLNKERILRRTREECESGRASRGRNGSNELIAGDLRQNVPFFRKGALCSYKEASDSIVGKETIRNSNARCRRGGTNPQSLLEQQTNSSLANSASPGVEPTSCGRTFTSEGIRSPTARETSQGNLCIPSSCSRKTSLRCLTQTDHVKTAKEMCNGSPIVLKSFIESESVGEVISETQHNAPLGTDPDRLKVRPGDHGTDSTTVDVPTDATSILSALATGNKPHIISNNIAEEFGIPRDSHSPGPLSSNIVVSQECHPAIEPPQCSRNISVAVPSGPVLFNHESAPKTSSESLLKLEPCQFAEKDDDLSESIIARVESIEQEAFDAVLFAV